MRTLVITAAVSLLAATAGLHAQQAGRGAPPPAAREAAALDLTGNWVSVDHRRLEMADGHAQEGRLRGDPAESRGPQGRRYMGPGARRGRRRAVPIVRRREHHARPGPAPHFVAGREHASDRHGCRNPEPVVSFRGGAASRVNRAGRGIRSPAGSTDRSWTRAGAHGEPQGGDDQPPSGLSPQERSTVQRRHDGDRVSTTSTRFRTATSG